jgi:hypothetical protein
VVPLPLACFDARMIWTWWDAADLLVLTVGYWLVDLVARGEGAVRLVRWFAAGAGSATLAVVLALPLVSLAPFWGWGSVPDAEPIRLLAVVLSVFLAWQAVTKDIDPVFGETHGACRVLLPIAVAASWWSPAFLPLTAVLLTSPFALWQHHSTLPMRILQALVAYVVASATATVLLPGSGLFADAAVVVWFVLTIQISHYFITALAKGWLGPRWYSWVTDNHMHHLAASSYSWGWARFVPWPLWRRVIGLVRWVEWPLQAFAFGVEALAPFALVHPIAGVVFCVLWAGFHVGVVSLSGLLFWDWILTDLAVAAVILMLPETVTDQVFGVVPMLLSLVFMAALPLRHKLWKPIPLGWWDTPFTQRMHWRAHGRSGRVYGVYNDFMCPHERLYGKVHACFLAPARGITYHLGEVWKRDLRDAIREAGPDLERLEVVRERFGIEPRDAAMAENHVAYLRRFFHAINRGARKQVLPSALRWLKAPGDQLYYWGELEPFRGQEEVVRVSLHYREEYFDGDRLQRLRDDLVLEIDIDESCADVPCRPEPTPKELDEMLLAHAAGRLIDLPGFGGGYVGSDDGKRSAISAAGG